jgi:hypothetical protein
VLTSSVPLMPPRAVVLLGPQRFDPSLGESVTKLGVAGRIAVITAGWQERESEDEDLQEHLWNRTVNLRLHERAEDVFKKDADLKAAHRERQEVLRHRQDFYRIRLEHSLEAERVIRARSAPLDILEDEEVASIEAIRSLDEWHLAQCARVRKEFEPRCERAVSPVLQKHKAEVTALIKDCDAVAIAGGHVATLLNRLMMFDIGKLIGPRVVFAWAAGAMAISERVVLFHDDPPQGPGASEVLDEGLGLAPRVVVFPEPEERLMLNRQDRMELLARRFAPAYCLGFPARSRVIMKGGRFSAPEGVLCLRKDGSHGLFDPKKDAA